VSVCGADLAEPIVQSDGGNVPEPDVVIGSDVTVVIGVEVKMFGDRDAPGVDPAVSAVEHEVGAVFAK
jgi:hypothetical protein